MLFWLKFSFNIVKLNHYHKLSINLLFSIDICDIKHFISDIKICLTPFRIQQTNFPD